MSLVDEIRTCTLCADQLPLEPRPILQGSSKSKVLIAGQAPGRIAHEKGIPFDDASGNRLRDWLGVSRDEFYNPDLFAVLPMGFCFPGSGKSGDLPPLPKCAMTWRDAVLAELRSVELTLVIGRYAMDWHLPSLDFSAGSSSGSVTSRVLQWRELLRQAPMKVSLPHPSPRNNRWLKRNPWFELELLPELKQSVANLLVQSRS
jgi:uracil-DNA glycosylase